MSITSELSPGVFLTTDYRPEYPGSQVVRQELELSAGTYLATQGNIVLQLDGRGSRGRGEDWRRELGEEGLGLADVEDQTRALRSADCALLPPIPHSC